MKKRMFIAGFATMLWFGARAEVTFGVRAGISYASLTQLIGEEVTYGGQIGFCVAGLMDIPLSQKFSLRPELAFGNLGGAYYSSKVEDQQIYFKTEQNEYNYYSIQAPVNLVYKITSHDWRFGVYGGPSLSVSTQARAKKMRQEEGDQARLRPFDLGSGVGFYVEYLQVFATIYTYTGFLDLHSQKQPNESELYQNNVAFSFGYWF